MYKLIVFHAGSIRDATIVIAREHNIEPSTCKFIGEPSALGRPDPRGFQDLPYIMMRPLTGYEQQYAAEHGLKPVTPEQMAALQRQPAPSKLASFTDEELIIELENRDRVNKFHTANVTLGEFTMKHTLRCHPDLFNCDIHAKLLQAFNENGGLAPMDEGLYRLWWEGEGDDRKLQMGLLTPPGTDAPAVMEGKA